MALIFPFPLANGIFNWCRQEAPDSTNLKVFVIMTYYLFTIVISPETAGLIATLTKGSDTLFKVVQIICICLHYFSTSKMLHFAQGSCMWLLFNGGPRSF